MYEYYRNRKSLMIGVDFDGTVVGHAYPHIGEPIPNAKEVLFRLKQRGHRIIIWTARNGKALENAKQFLIDNNYPFDTINKSLEDSPYRSWPKIAIDIFQEDRAAGGLIPWLVFEQIIINIENGGTSELPRDYIQSLLSK